MKREEIEITPQELEQKLTGPDQKPFLLDVREQWEFQIARLPDSHLIPLDSLPDLLDELDPAKEIVVVCHHGVRSLNATLYLRQMGFSHVKSLAGGLELWSQVIDRSLPRY
jgi:rhodanese-related sulfurtransferase